MLENPFVLDTYICTSWISNNWTSSSNLQLCAASLLLQSSGGHNLEQGAHLIYLSILVSSFVFLHVSAKRVLGIIELLMKVISRMRLSQSTAALPTVSLTMRFRTPTCTTGTTPSRCPWWPSSRQRTRTLCTRSSPTRWRNSTGILWRSPDSLRWWKCKVIILLRAMQYIDWSGQETRLHLACDCGRGIWIWNNLWGADNMTWILIQWMPAYQCSCSHRPRWPMCTTGAWRSFCGSAGPSWCLRSSTSPSMRRRRTSGSGARRPRVVGGFE